MSDQIIPIAISWVLYSIRETIGLTSVRNVILKNKIDQLGEYDIKYGKTFSKGDTFEDIYDLINENTNNLIFTSNADIVSKFTGGQKKKTKKRKRNEELVESHYVSFILDRVKMTVTIIDPSRKNGKMGIYNPYIGLHLESFLKKEGYNVKWLEMTSPCQISYDDVFCQSWTLYLIFKYYESEHYVSDYNNDNVIYIPKKQDKKYKKLLDFFKELASYEIFRTELKISYNENIKNHLDQKILSTYDPCCLLLNMITEDMNV